LHECCTLLASGSAPDSTQTIAANGAQESVHSPGKGCLQLRLEDALELTRDLYQDGTTYHDMQESSIVSEEMPTTPPTDLNKCPEMGCLSPEERTSNFLAQNALTSVTVKNTFIDGTVFESTESQLPQALRKRPFDFLPEKHRPVGFEYEAVQMARLDYQVNLRSIPALDCFPTSPLAGDQDSSFRKHKVEASTEPIVISISRDDASESTGIEDSGGEEQRSVLVEDLRSLSKQYQLKEFHSSVDCQSILEGRLPHALPKRCLDFLPSDKLKLPYTEEEYEAIQAARLNYQVRLRMVPALDTPQSTQPLSVQSTMPRRRITQLPACEFLKHIDVVELQSLREAYLHLDAVPACDYFPKRVSQSKWLSAHTDTNFLMMSDSF
jgi:hypothetical protein